MWIRSALFLLLWSDGTLADLQHRNTYGSRQSRPQGYSRQSGSNSGCSGNRQSPVNIDTYKTVGEFPWKQLGFHYYHNPPQSMKIFNNGRSAVLRTNGPFVMGGNLPLNERYRLYEIVFHWGNTYDSGSEHSFNGRRFAGEIQLVHYNSKYNSYSGAVKQEDGIVIMSVIVAKSQNDNQNLNSVISSLRNIQEAGSSSYVQPFPVKNLLPYNDNDFYRYDGSLTVPGCEESVTWLIFDHSIIMSTAQLQEFRRLNDKRGAPITSNVRPIQNLNGRNVSRGQTMPSWSHYGPDGQDVWASRISPDCGGNKQSPIDIITTRTVPERSWAPLTLTNFERTPETLPFQNNDNGAQALPMAEFKYQLQGGPFITPYTLFMFHFHWGSYKTLGSEHTVDGRRYAAEIHLLVYNDTLGGLFQSVGVEKGIYEIAIFMELSDYDNPKLQSIMNGLTQVVPSNASTLITPFAPRDLLPDNIQDFYVYDGALSAPVPTCDETAYFMIFKDSIPISRSQLATFANIENAAGYKIRDNFRRLQPLNGRPVFSSVGGLPNSNQEMKYY